MELGVSDTCSDGLPRAQCYCWDGMAICTDVAVNGCTKMNVKLCLCVRMKIIRHIALHGLLFW